MTLIDPVSGVAAADHAASTVRLTTAQALVRWMVAQRSELLDGTRVPLFAGVFGIFGHGNVLGLGTALYDVRDRLPTWRGQNEEGMALAAVAYAKATNRRQVMAATSSIGPGALNMVTAAGLAHANRLPVLLLPGDTFTGRGPDPVLQQVEHFGDPTTTVNDAFRAVARYFDRITRPEQLLATLPQVARVLTDPADAGPVVLALPQDVQAEEYDFPVAMFAERLHRVPRPRPDIAALTEAERLLRSARRPLLVVGGGARYSGAGADVLSFAEAHGVPVVETPAGRTLVPHDHVLHGGRTGHHRVDLGEHPGRARRTWCSPSAPGCRTSPPPRGRRSRTTSTSWRVNTARFDAVKHAAHPLVGDARDALGELDAALARLARRPGLGRARPGRASGLGRARRPVARRGRARRLADLRPGCRRGQRRRRARGLRPHRPRAGFPASCTAAGARCAPTTRRWTWSTASRAWATSSPGAWGAAMARATTHPDGLVTAPARRRLLPHAQLRPLLRRVRRATRSCSCCATTAATPSSTGCRPARAPPASTTCSSTPADRERPIRRTEACASTSPRTPARSAAPSRRCRPAAPSTTSAAPTLAAREAARATRRPAVVVCRTHPTTWTEAGAWWEVGVPAALSRPRRLRRAQGHPAAVAGMTGRPARPPLRAAVIGFGWMGRAHAAAYQRLHHHYPHLGRRVELVAVADDQRPALDDAVARFGVLRTHLDWRELVAAPDVDVVSVTAPNWLHREIGVAVAEAGKHLWIEKPVGLGAC